MIDGLFLPGLSVSSAVFERGRTMVRVEGEMGERDKVYSKALVEIEKGWLS